MSEALTISQMPQLSFAEAGLSSTYRTGACLIRVTPTDMASCLFDLDHAETRIGRDSDCEIEFADTSLSPIHAVIERSDGRYLIRDCGSMHGTFVNDTRIRATLLAAGDQIRVGNQIFRFLSADRPEAQIADAVYEMTTRDGLTGVRTRRYFLEAFHREIRRSLRHWRPITLLHLDVDGLETVNFHLGPLAGNECLQGLCRRLGSRIRGEDLLARSRGTEFLLSLTEAPLKQSIRVAQDLRRLIEHEPFVTSTGLVDLTISIGVGYANGQAPVTADEILQQAAENLAQAKAEGRNRLCF